MRAPGSYLRCAVLMSLAALVLHSVRSWAELGGHAQAEVARTAHGYLAATTLLVGVLTGLAAGHLIAQLVMRWRSADGTSYTSHRGRRLWWSATLALLCISLGQELIESFVATGGPAGLVDVISHGGWTAFPLAALLGAGVALGVRGADAALVIASRARQRTAGSRLLAPHRVPLPTGHPRRIEPLADASAERAPPLRLFAS